MTARTTYWERYVAGAEERVWAELQALGAAVREEPLYRDALAVARETMRRARANIELLIPRLDAIGYQFGSAWATPRGPQVWLLARRSVRDPTDLTYYFAYAPRSRSLLRLAQVASTRYTVEQVIKEAKSEVGFDRYEVRSWQSWYRHITLSMLAQVWLADQRRVAGENNGTGGSLRARSAAALGGDAALA